VANVKQAVEKAAEKVADKIAGLVDVELKEAKDGVHTIFAKDGHAIFVNGVAKVKEEVAKELKELGFIK
jgi:phosphotransferase system IIB component